MLKSTEKIIDCPLSHHIIRDVDLEFFFKGSPARRYGLVNRMLKKGELVRICRGFYTLNKKYQKNLPHEYYFANRVVPNSFITAETALSFHNHIPERVTQIISIAAFSRHHAFNTPFGIFVYDTVPVKPQYFYFGVGMIELDDQLVYVATPLRALMDYIYMHKIENANIDFLENSLRIEKENIFKITHNEIKKLKIIYKSHYVQQFLKNLSGELKNDE